MLSERNRIAVFGASGYIGGRLVGYLKKTGCEVASISRRLDILEVAASELSRAIAGCDGVVSLIGANENAAAKDPAAALKLSTVAARRIGDAVAESGVPRFVQFSTIHVYGSLSGEIDEGRPAAPVHAYGAAHSAAETALQSISAERGLDAIVFRLANAVGPPATKDVDRWTLLTNDLARTLAETGKLQLRSAGLGWRDFISLAEVCRATRHALLLPAHRGVRTFNLGTGMSRRVLDVAERMAEIAEPLLGRRPELLTKPPGDAEADSAAFAFQIGALRRTGFEPAPDIDDELEGLLRFALDHFGRHTAVR